MKQCSIVRNNIVLVVDVASKLLHNNISFKKYETSYMCLYNSSIVLGSFYQVGAKGQPSNKKKFISVHHW